MFFEIESFSEIESSLAQLWKLNRMILGNVEKSVCQIVATSNTAITTTKNSWSNAQYYQEILRHVHTKAYWTAFTSFETWEFSKLFPTRVEGGGGGVESSFWWGSDRFVIYGKVLIEILDFK